MLSRRSKSRSFSCHANDTYMLLTMLHKQRLLRLPFECRSLSLMPVWISCGLAMLYFSIAVVSQCYHAAMLHARTCRVRMVVTLTESNAPSTECLHSSCLHKCFEVVRTCSCRAVVSLMLAYTCTLSTLTEANALCKRPARTAV